MTRIKQEENLRFSALFRGEKLFCCSIAEFGIKRVLPVADKAQRGRDQKGARFKDDQLEFEN